MKNIEVIEVKKFPCVLEEIFDIFIQLVGIGVVYLLFTEIGKIVIGESFSKDILLSMVVLPAIVVLKQVGDIFHPYFITVKIIDKSLVVKQGLLTTFEDSLSLDTVENIETVTTFLGKMFDYSTIRVYAYGSWVIVPNVKDPQKLKDKLTKIIKDKRDKS